MKGIILAGGAGSRLHPMTLPITKQLLPVYNKPMIYYPLAVLMLAGVRDVLIISTPQDAPRFKALLGNGSHLGIKIRYASQTKPRGIAEAFIIGKDFIGNDKVWLILGDNLFFGSGLPDMLKDAYECNAGATVFGYYVHDPERYGVMGFDTKGRVKDIVEKPLKPKSHYAVTGLYLYDSDVCALARGLKPSKRGELEITDLNNIYLRSGRLDAKLMGRGFAWLDTGTADSLLEAANFIQVIQKRQGLEIACIEEIAYRQGFINRTAFEKLALSLGRSAYGGYLKSILDGR